MYRSNVLVCGGTGCTSSNSELIIQRLKEEIAAKGLEQEVNVIRTGCFGLCALGPIMIVYPEGAFYSMVKPDDVPEIVEEHLLKGRIVKRLLYQETVVENSNSVKSLNHTPFYEKQHRVALRNCGVINPEDIDEYIAVDGYAGVGQGSHGNDPAGRHRCNHQVRPARPRRRRFPDRPEVALCRTEPGGSEICVLQRGRR